MWVLHELEHFSDARYQVMTKRIIDALSKSGYVGGGGSASSGAASCVIMREVPSLVFEGGKATQTLPSQKSKCRGNQQRRGRSGD